jgi:hypothetical protein
MAKCSRPTRHADRANLGGGHDVDVSELRYFMKNNL